MGLDVWELHDLGEFILRKRFDGVGFYLAYGNSLSVLGGKWGWVLMLLMWGLVV